MNGDWVPKTKLGKDVLAGKIKSIDEILKKGERILEPGIVDHLLPNLETDLIWIGQRRGKFGGGGRWAFRQTQRKVAEGARTSFSAMAVVGNKDGYVGLGLGKAKDPVPARDLATRNAKLNIIHVMRGCGSWQCGCDDPHSIPYKTEGKFASVRVMLMPAPKGAGLVVNDEIKKIMRLAGIRDIWCKSFGQTRTRHNMAKAAFQALKNLSAVKR